MLSPDGRTLAFTARYESPAELYTMPVEGGAPTRWSYEPESSIATRWTPDGRLVYTASAHAGRINEHREGADDLAWSTDGEHLFFLSDRDLDSRVGSPWGSRQPDPFFDEEWELYVAALRADGDTPFRAPNELTGDEGAGVTERSSGSGGAPGAASESGTVDGGTGDRAQAAPEVRGDGDGLMERVWKVPVESGTTASSQRRRTASSGSTADRRAWAAPRSRPSPSRGRRPGSPEAVTVAENVGS